MGKEIKIDLSNKLTGRASRDTSFRESLMFQRSLEVPSLLLKSIFTESGDDQPPFNFLSGKESHRISTQILGRAERITIYFDLLSDHQDPANDSIRVEIRLYENDHSSNKGPKDVIIVRVDLLGELTWKVAT